MTEKQLSQMRILNREIAAKKDRLRELENPRKGTFMKITGVALINPCEITPEMQAEIDALHAQLEADLLRCLNMLRAMEEYISSVDDSRIRLILSLRYINGLSWQQVAFSIGEHDEQYPRRLHNSFFKKQSSGRLTPCNAKQEI